MGTIFNFNSYDNSKQNNTVIINNDIDKILEQLKEVNLSDKSIAELKIAIQKDEVEAREKGTIGENVKNWCASIFNQVTSGAIVNTALPIVQDKLQSILSAIYHFPIQF